MNNGQQTTRIIRADIKDVRGKLNTQFKKCIGAGRANEGLRADWQQQLATVKRECGFTYIRMHGLLCDDMGVYKEDKKGTPLYNFQYIDVLYDYLISIGMKPFVELGFMPAALASGDKTVFWWKGNVTPPKDYGKWEEFIYRLVLHFTERYGTEEVRTWYFEVWNEPNLSGFWAGSQDEYFKLYRYTVSAIKRVDNIYRVGGPATAGAAWIPEMINFCSTNEIPIDFISSHAYGVKSGFLDEYGNEGTVLDKDEYSVSGDIIRSRKQIAESALPDLEMHFTEWSSSYTPSDPIHDSYHEAAYILEKIKQVGDNTDSMSYWVFTDIFEEAGPRFSPFHGGFGLLNYQGIRKSAFYAFQFLNKLGEFEIRHDDSESYVCKDSDNNVQILFWNFTNTHPGDSVNNQVYYRKDLPAKPAGKVGITLTEIPKGNYLLTVYKTGYKENDPHTEYIRMGLPQQLSVAQVTALRNKSKGLPILQEMITVDDSKMFSYECEISENDVVLAVLTRL